MADVKLVIYPRPTDFDVFEKVYQEEHVPLAVAKLSGKTKIVAVLPKFTFRRCKLWKHARRLKAAKRRSHTP